MLYQQRRERDLTVKGIGNGDALGMLLWVESFWAQATNVQGFNIEYTHLIPWKHFNFGGTIMETSGLSKYQKRMKK